MYRTGKAPEKIISHLNHVIYVRKTRWITDFRPGFSLKTDSMETFHHFVKADILILDKSSFGYVAGLYNTNNVIYNPFWDKKYHKWKLIEEII